MRLNHDNEKLFEEMVLRSKKENVKKIIIREGYFLFYILLKSKSDISDKKLNEIKNYLENIQDCLGYSFLTKNIENIIFIIERDFDLEDLKASFCFF